MVDILKAREKAKKEKKNSLKKKKTEDLATNQEALHPEKKADKKAISKKNTKKIKKKTTTSSSEEKVEKENALLQETDYIITEDLLAFLAFKLGDETYAINIDTIDEIIVFQQHTPVPNTADFISGVLSLRGRMIPVLDGRIRLGHKTKEADEETRIIIVRIEEEYMGIIVDSVREVITVGKEEIEDPPAVISSIEADYLKGVCYRDTELVIVLDFERFLKI